MSQDFKDILKVLITVTLLIIYILLFGACASRKVDKNNVKSEVKTEVNNQVKNNISVVRENLTTVNLEENELEITPIDTAKVLVINGKIYKNAKVKILSKKTTSTISNLETVKDLSTKETRVKVEEKKNTRVKNTVSTPFNYWLLLWLLIPLSIYFIYRHYRDYFKLTNL